MPRTPTPPRRGAREPDFVEVIAEEVAKEKRSLTGRYLAPALKERVLRPRASARAFSATEDARG